MNITNFSFLPPAFFLLFTTAGTLLIQSAGYFLGHSLLLPSAAISAALSLYITYWRIFEFSDKNKALLLVYLLALGIIGILSSYLLDMTADGIGYQQPAIAAIINGWNPLTKTDMTWQNVYPSATWQLGATLALIFGSIEAAKMYTILWLFICVPVLLAGLQNHFGAPLRRSQILCMELIVLCPVVLAQALTHYVDAALYLSGITFIGGLLFLRKGSRHNALAFAILFSCTLFIVNAKLSGIYHAAVLCFAALVYLSIGYRKLPIKEACALLGCGLVAVVFTGFHPYVTNLIHYGSLMPMYGGGGFSSGQKPVNIAQMDMISGFFYSIFSAVASVPKEAAVLKFPWSISSREWFFAGVADNRVGGFGVWFGFALCFLGVYLTACARNITQWDWPLAAVAFILLLTSIAFPQNWWLRYVPFAYAAFLLFLLAVQLPQHPALKVFHYVTIAILYINSTISLVSALQYQQIKQTEFMTLVEKLAAKPKGSVYLVPPGEDYLTYNQAHVTLIRRFGQLGIPVTVKVNATCPNEAATLAEFKVCH